MEEYKKVMEEKKLSGIAVANHHYEMLVPRIAQLVKKNIRPTLRVILVGDDPAGKIYTRKKAEKCRELNLDGEVISMSTSTTTEQLTSCIQSLNADPHVHGILVQLPLPTHIDEKKILATIHPDKDVDGFHNVNIGRLQVSDEKALIPCTAKGIIALLQFYKIKTIGTHVVVLGRSKIVGRPIAQLLSSKSSTGNATVTICHSYTENIPYYTSQADIIIAAIGKPLFVKKEMVKTGAVVIDVGINLTPVYSDYYGKKKIVGDVDYNQVIDKVSAITPVPGGIGPMTIAMLMENTVQAAEHIHESASK